VVVVERDGSPALDAMGASWWDVRRRFLTIYIIDRYHDNCFVHSPNQYNGTSATSPRVPDEQTRLPTLMLVRP
jgi:hypothetical protein